MPATFEFEEDNGAAAGAPAAGTVRTPARAEINWKNIDDSTTLYSLFPITAGNNSYVKNQFAHFSGAYNNILAGLEAHTAGVLGAGLTLKGQKAMTVDGDNHPYATPSTVTDATLTNDLTSVIAIGSGVAVWFGATSPQAAGKTPSTAANPAYSNWLASQLQTTVAAAPGDTVTVTKTLQYQEN